MLLTFSCLMSVASYAQQSVWLDSLKANTKSFTILNNMYEGTGWGLLTNLISNADYVLVGEEHGTKEIPFFCEQVVSILKSVTVVLEVDPYTAEELNRVSRLSTTEAMTALKLHPFNYSFYSADAEFDFIQRSAKSKITFTGIDQVSLLSSSLFFNLLHTKATTKQGKVIATEFAKAAYEKDREAIEAGKLEEMFLPSLSTENFKRLDDAFTNEPAAAKDMIAQLKVSQQIYLNQRTGHSTRISLMKKNLLSVYQEHLNNAKGKVFFKFGANHSASTGSFMGNDDIGNLAKNLADANAQNTLHILTLGKEGTTNTFSPSFQQSHNRTFSSADKNSHLNALYPLFDLHKSNEVMVVDLRSLRKAWNQGKIQIDAGIIRTIVNGYDVLVVFPKVSPSSYIK